MLKKMFKSCLAIAMVCAMAAPVYADVKVGGRARANLQQTTVKDGASYLDFESDARINMSGSTEAGAWTGSAKFELDLDEDSSTVKFRDKWVMLENESMSFKFGRQYVHGIEVVTGYHHGDNIHTIQWIGEYFGRRQDFLNIGLKGVGANVWVGMNKADDGNGNYKQTDFGAFYGGNFGMIDLNVTYASKTGAIDEKDSAGAGAGSEEDGYAGNEIAFGVGANLSETMAVGLNYGMINDKAGNADDATKVTMMDLNFSMGLGGDAGIFFSYGTSSSDDGSDNPTAKTNMMLEYGNKVGGANVYAVYGSSTEKDDDDSTDTATTDIGAGMKYNF